MNIYIHIEIAVRELDSKLLLAAIAASRGHDVLVSDISSIMKGALNGVLAPGIFHTKSLGPSDKKIARHQSLLDRKFYITSLDEEGGLVDYGYTRFAETRYSEKTIAQASAVFGWGAEDTETLRRMYPKFAFKIHQTGSPRADLWSPFFFPYWVVPKGAPKRPYLLVVSNMGVANNMLPLHECIRSERKSGYYRRAPEMFSEKFSAAATDYLMTLAFIEAVRYLAEHNEDYDIVLRPHPAENIDAWSVYLEEVPNVKVIREGSITAWINNAFAVMHNGCTTAIETTLSGKPLITYLPSQQRREGGLSNELGHRIETPQELSEVLRSILDRGSVDENKEETLKSPDSVKKKVFADEFELAAQKIVKIWENLFHGGVSQRSNWSVLRLLLLSEKFKRLIWLLLSEGLRGKFKLTNGNYKFSPMESTDIRERLRRLEEILGLSEPLECELLSERAVLIRKKSK